MTPVEPMTHLTELPQRLRTLPDGVLIPWLQNQVLAIGLGPETRLPVLTATELEPSVLGALIARPTWTAITALEQACPVASNAARWVRAATHAQVKAADPDREYYSAADVMWENGHAHHLPALLDLERRCSAYPMFDALDRHARSAADVLRLNDQWTVAPGSWDERAAAALTALLAQATREGHVFSDTVFQGRRMHAAHAYHQDPDGPIHADTWCDQIIVRHSAKLAHQLLEARVLSEQAVDDWLHLALRAPASAAVVDVLATQPGMLDRPHVADPQVSWRQLVAEPSPQTAALIQSMGYPAEGLAALRACVVAQYAVASTTRRRVRP